MRLQPVVLREREEELQEELGRPGQGHGAAVQQPRDACSGTCVTTKFPFETRRHGLSAPVAPCAYGFG